MGNRSSSNDHVKGPGLFSVQSASGALPEFVDFYDRPEKKWKVRRIRDVFALDAIEHTHTYSSHKCTSTRVPGIRLMLCLCDRTIINM